MKKNFLFYFGLALVLGFNQVNAQVGIGTTNPNSSSMLDVVSSTKGMLFPRMTIAERDAIATPATGLLVFCTDNNQFYVNKGSPGTPNWVMISTQWNLNGTALYYTGGNIGIGLTNPAYACDVAGDINFTGTLRNNGVPVAYGVSTVTASSPVTSSGGANPNIAIPQANTTTSGYLSSGDWNVFNNKQNSLLLGNVSSADMTITGGTGAVIGSGLGLTIIKGNLSSADMVIAGGANAVLGPGTNMTIKKGSLSESTSSVLNILGGTNATLGTGTTIQVKQAGPLQSGYLSNIDWGIFNGKQDPLTFGNLTSSDMIISGGTGAVKGSGTSMVINKGNLISPDMVVSGGANAVLGTGTSLQINKGALSETTSSVLTITNGAGAVLGTGTTIQVKQAGPLQSGYLSSADWNTFNSATSQWLNSGANIYYNLGFVGIGNPPPATNLHVSETNGDIIPALKIEQLGGGDAALEYAKQGFSISSGVHQADNLAFKICSQTTLTGAVYNAPNQLFRIHTASGKQGIADFNHQSRVRAHMTINGAIPMGVWTVLNFMVKTFDEHNEYMPGNGTFIAREEGYYQVNARVEFNPSQTSVFMANGYVEIAIYKNNTVYAEGNKLQITFGTTMPYQVLYNNNAPNVGDVLWLQAGDIVDIRVFQNYSGTPAVTLPNHEKTYFSIHKIS